MNQNIVRKAVEAIQSLYQNKQITMEEKNALASKLCRGGLLDVYMELKRVAPCNMAVQEMVEKVESGRRG